MTKELELPELPEPDFLLRWDSQRAAYYVSKPQIGDTQVYTTDQMRAYALATLAKTQEGMVNIPVPRWQDKHEEYGGIFSDIKCAQDEIDQLRMRLAGISQQKAPEGEPRDYCLQLLVAAGHITQELADQTRAIANSVAVEDEDHG